MNCDRSGTLTILVVGIFPILGNRDFGGLRWVGIGDGEATSHVT